jgi:hypothetical protein
VDGLAKASILDIDGVAVPSAAFLLDTYTGAAAAYSVRRLASATTVLMRVRRETAGGTGDDDEADVTYDANNELSLDSAISNASTGVTATTLGQFINVGMVGGTTYTNPDSLSGTASCFVNTWYDQDGSTDMVQSSGTIQPYIHDGTANTDLQKTNGHAHIQFTRTDSTTMQSASQSWSTAGDMTLFIAKTPEGGVGDTFLYHQLDDPSSTRSFGLNSIDNRLSIFGSTGAYSLNNTQSTAGFYLFSYLHEGGVEGNSYEDGTLNTTTSNTISMRTGAGNANLGGTAARNYATFAIQELIHYPDLRDTDRAAIETNINDGLDIY